MSNTHHNHEHMHGHAQQTSRSRILTIRSHSGLSGDMFLAGLLKLSCVNDDMLDAILKGILPQLQGCVRLTTKLVASITGYHASVTLPSEHEHRDLKTITSLIDASTMDPLAKDYAIKTFSLLAKAEGAVHSIAVEDVHFHEVGALDSIVDICLSCELFARLHVDRLVVSPLPLADGSVCCAHGVLPTPAPAVIAMLQGICVRSFEGSGETVTPTAIALLHTFSADFGAWPNMLVEKTALVFGTKEFPNTPNGATFALGTTTNNVSHQVFGAGDSSHAD